MKTCVRKRIVQWAIEMSFQFVQLEDQLWYSPNRSVVFIVAWRMFANFANILLKKDLRVVVRSTQRPQFIFVAWSSSRGRGGCNVLL